MRRLVAALVIALALSLTACGGSTPPPAPSATPPAADAGAAPPPPGAAAAQPVSTTNKLSPRETGTGTPFPLSQQSPVVVADLIKRHQPMLVLFFDPDQATSADQRREVDEAMKQYRGMIDLVAFDVTGMLDKNSKKLDAVETSQAQQIALLTQDLKVGFTPTVILVDKQGQISARFRGYVDRALLNREILKATQ